jgi:hypothetical protein
MPIAKGTAPSGEKFDFYVPRGTTAEEAPALARSAYFRRRQGIDVTQPPPPPESTIGGEFMRGAESLASALRTTAGAVLGDEEAAALAALERSEDIAQRYGEGPSFQAVREAEGVVDTIGTALGQIPRAVAGQVPQLGATAAGAALGSFIPGVGTVIGGGLGALASLIPQFAGYNIERQAEADIAEGRPVDIDTGKAVGTAALQAVPELVGQYFILGRGVVGRLLRKDPGDVTELATRANAEKIIDTANRSLGRTVGRGVATGAAAEMPTEVAQQILERAQAGLDVLSDEAMAEYGEAAYLAATVGGTLGPIGSVTGRSRARRQREELAARTQKAEEALPGGLFGGQERASIFDESDIKDIGIGVDTKTAERLKGLDLNDPEQRTEAASILRKYVNNKAVQTSAPATVTKARAILDSIDPAPEPDAETTPVAPPPDTAQLDLFAEADKAETREIQELYDQEELAALQAEETATQEAVQAQQAAERAKTEKAKATVDATELEMEIGEADRRVAQAQQERTAQSRNAVLQPILERGDITDVTNLRRAFSAELARQGFTNTEPTQDELAAITRRSYELDEEGTRAAIEAEQGAAGVAELETLIPEKGEKQTQQQPTEQAEPTEPAERAAEAEPVSESTAEKQAVEAAPTGRRDRVAEAAARRRAAKEAELAAKREQAATARAEQEQRTASRASLDAQATTAEIDADALINSFEEIETKADRNSFLSKLAYDSIDGTPEQKADAQAKIEALRDSDRISQDVKDDLVAMQNSTRHDLGLALPARALASSSVTLEPEVVELIRDGKLVEALDVLANNKDKTIAKVAKAVSSAILKDGGTKVTLESNLMGTDGRILAGTFDPKTNTIIINKDLNPTAHVLLHEALHAVTSHEIAKKSSPITKQLQTLFDNVKDRLEDSYGATNLDEFVAEAFSNPEFQAKLASMDTKGNKLPIWKQFVNAVINTVRRALNLPFTKVTTARNEVDQLVTELMSPAPEYRNAARLNMAVTAKEEGKLLGDVLNNFGGPVTQDMIQQFNDTMPSLTRQGRQWFMDILPLNSIADFIKDSDNKVLQDLGAELDSLFKIIQQKNGSRQEYLLKTKDTAKQLDRLFKKLGDAQRALFNKVVMESTLRRVDPSRDREYYEKFRYSFIDQDGKEVRSGVLFDTKEERDAAVAKLRDADTKNELTFALTNPSDGKLEEYDLVKADFKALDPEARKAYETLRDAYTEAYTELRMAIVERINAVDAVTEEALFAKRAYKDQVLKDLLNKESIEPYFPLFRKGDFWYNHQGFDPYTGNLEQYKVAFESEQEREAYAREVFIEERQRILDSEITTVVEPREAARAQALAEGATPQQAEDIAVNAVLEGTRAERPTNARGEKTAVDIQWAQGVLADVVRKKGEAAKRAKDKALADGLSEAEADQIADQTLRAGSAIETIVQDAMLEAMPERSLERAFKKRQNVRGAQSDAIDVFRQRMPAFMGQIDNIRFDSPLTQTQNNLDRIASGANGTPDQEYAAQIAAQGKKYIDFVRDPQIASYARRLKSAGFLMTLGFNLSSAVVNSFILPIVVLPFLAGKYGFGASSAAMYRAMRMYMNTGMRRRLQPFGGAPEGTEFDGPSLANLDPENLPEEYQQYKPLIEELVARGAANASTVGDMLDVDNPTGGAFDRNLTRVNAISGFLFHQGERLNRQVTAMAAYDLAMAEQKKQNKGAEVTEEQQNKIIDQVLLDVEHTNSGALIETAPRIAQGNIASVLLMYKRFGVSMAYLQMKMAKQALGIGNYDADQTKDAKKQLVGLFGMSGLLAGAQGLPLYGVLAAMANMFFLDDEDDDFDSLVASYIGEGPYSGVLNKIFDVDVAPRIGMTNLLFRTLPNKEYEDTLSYAMELAGGPLFGIAQRISRSGELLKDGEYRRGIEGFLPAGLSAPLKSIRYATDGATTLRGDPIVEDMSARSIFGQFFGFAPAGYTKQLEINARDKRVDRTINEKRTRLLRQRYVAYRVGDFEGVRDIDQEINEFNQRNPEVRITGDTKARSLRQHRITSQIARQLGGITISPRRLEKIIQKRLEETGERDFFL